MVNNQIRRREAILTGAKAADSLHKKLKIRDKINKNLSSVDVYSAILDLNILLMFKDLSGPLGISLQKPSPGILINRSRPPMMQRFTAAHELGHIFLEHKGSIDNDVLDLSSNTSRPLEEVSADAFASEFLMPKWLMVLHTRKHGWATPSFIAKPEIIYQLSLRIGASFEATLWNLRDKIPAESFSLIQTTTPKDQKIKLLGDQSLENSWNDVWYLGPSDDGLSYNIRKDDYVVLELPSLPSSGYIWDIDSLQSSEAWSVLKDSHLNTSAELRIGCRGSRKIIFRIKESGEFKLILEEKRPWKRGSVRATFRSDFNIQELERGGLSNAARLRLAS